MLINALRGYLAEFGVVAGQGQGNFSKLRARLASEEGAARSRRRARRYAG